MKRIYFALIEEEPPGERRFVVTDKSSLEENSKEWGSDATVHAVYGVDLEEKEEAMLNALLGIDVTTDVPVVQDLVASLVTAGYRFGR